MLRVVNSPFYSHGNKVTTIPFAISLLGYSVVRSLALMAFSRSLFSHTRNPLFRLHIWQHSLLTAIASQTICRELGNAEACVVTLKKHGHKLPAVQLGGLLDESSSLNSAQRIFEKLGYGIILISSAGEIISVSRSMLSSAKLPVNDASITSLCAAIPFNFYNDIIWCLALAGQSGVFENYRIRIRLAGEENVSIL